MSRTGGAHDPRKQHSTSEIFGANGHRFLMNRENNTFVINLIEGGTLTHKHAKIRKLDLEERVRHAKEHGKDEIQLHIGSTIVTEKRNKIESYLKRQAQGK